jgi:hypothetical protein
MRLGPCQRAVKVARLVVELHRINKLKRETLLRLCSDDKTKSPNSKVTLNMRVELSTRVEPFLLRTRPDPSDPRPEKSAVESSLRLSLEPTLLWLVAENNS